MSVWDTIKGAGIGLATGGPTGAIIGGIGNSAGGLWDSIKNSFNPSQSQYQDSGQLHDLINRGIGNSNGAAPQLNAGPQDQFRQGQLQQMQQLQGIASGQQQGAGELAAQRQAQNAVAQQQALARMGRGGNAALGFRNAANNAAGIGLAGAGQAQQAAMTDQMNAQNMLGQTMNAGRGADIGMAGQNANLQLQQGAQNNQMYQQMLQNLLGMNQTQLQTQQPGIGPALLSQGGQIASAVAMHSDERLKTDVADATDDIDEMLDKVFPKAWVYKDSKHGTGRRTGVMAQDLARSKAGADIVYESTDGLALDRDKLITASFASIARLNHRLRELESR